MASFAIAYVGISTKKTTPEGLILSNVEALADPEIVVGPFCMWKENVICDVYPEEQLVIWGIPQ